MVLFCVAGASSAQCNWEIRRLGESITNIQPLSTSLFFGRREDCLYRSSDSGSTWAPLHCLNNLLAFEFIDTENGWAIHDLDAFSVTKNGGTSWETLRFDKVVIRDAHFVDAQHGWLVGEEYEPGNTILGWILHTRDGGRSWIRQRVATQSSGNLRLTDVWGISPQEAWLIASDNRLRYTHNSGETWEAVNLESLLPPNSKFVNIQFNHHRTGWVTEYFAPTYLLTTDGGSSWSYRKGPSNVTIDSLIHVNERSAFAVGYGRVYYQESDQGDDTSEWNISLDFRGDERDHFRLYHDLFLLDGKWLYAFSSDAFALCRLPDSYDH